MRNIRTNIPSMVNSLESCLVFINIDRATCRRWRKPRSDSMCFIRYAPRWKTGWFELPVALPFPIVLRLSRWWERPVRLTWRRVKLGSGGYGMAPHRLA